MAKAVTQRVFEQIQTHKHILIHLLSQTPFIYQSTVLEAKKHGAPINIMRFVSTTDLAIGCIFTFRIHETCPTRTSCLPNLLPLLRLLSLIDTAPSSLIQHICYADEHNPVFTITTTDEKATGQVKSKQASISQASSFRNYPIIDTEQAAGAEAHNFKFRFRLPTQLYRIASDYDARGRDRDTPDDRSGILRPRIRPGSASEAARTDGKGPTQRHKGTVLEDDR